MIEFILWYLLVSLIGLVAFPLLFTLLPGLPGRGYGFSRVAGLLFWCFGYWLLASFSLTMNDAGGALLAFGVVLLLGIFTWRRGSSSIARWAQANRRHILVVEVLFFGAFAVWALIRSANPEIFGTEKPMELAFINAILKSPELPPRDPWLSGYAISYYYFGYLITASLSRLTGVIGSVAFNLAISLVFALGSVGAYTLVYDILSSREIADTADEREDGGGARRSIQPFALLGPVFVLLLSNVVGLLEVLHARGIFWFRNTSGELVSPFWQWVDLQELSQPPSEPFTWLPRNFGVGSWWWWRASRVIQDYDLSGGWKEVIDEFPFFSFLLGDLHPHVLAIPFVFLGMALALNLYLGGARGKFNFIGFRLNLSLPSFLLAAIVLGGLAFLNIWDFPTFLVLFSATYTLLQINRRGWSWKRVGEFIGFTVFLGLVGYIIYLPFHLSFSSQAQGILPNLIYPTRGTHLWIMFGLFFIPLFGFLFYSYRQSDNRGNIWKGILLASGLMLALMLFSLILGGVILSLSSISPTGFLGARASSLNNLSGMFLGSLGAGTGGELFGEALTRRVQSPGGWVTLLALLGLTLGLLWPRRTVDEPDPETQSKKKINPFVLLLVLIGTLIVIAPEFVYLLDQFGWRINTVFKFYYQAWLIWAVAAVVGLAIMASGSRAWRLASGVGLILILGTGLLYPIFGIWDRTQGLQPDAGLRLDGAERSPYLNGEDRLAVDWLGDAPDGILAEAIGGSYSEYGRISAHSGYPTVLGWPGHESQWRGGATEIGSRETDIESLYTTRDWVEALRVLGSYDIRYIYIGALERSLYDVNEAKFRENLPVVYEFGGVTIYESLLLE